MIVKGSYVQLVRVTHNHVVSCFRRRLSPYLDAVSNICTLRTGYFIVTRDPYNETMDSINLKAY
jgi:hypothetical protein